MKKEIREEIERLYTASNFSPNLAKDFLTRLISYRDVCPEDIKEKLESAISHCEMEIRKYDLIRKITDLKGKFELLVSSFSSNKDIRLSYIEYKGESFGIIIHLGDYDIYINHKFYQEIWICIRHIITLRNKEIHPIFPKADDLCPLIWERLRFVRGSYVFVSSFDTLYNDVEKIVSNIRKNYSALIPILDSSTLRFPNGTMKVRRKSWKSPARIKGIYQESNRDFIQGIKKSDQPTYDNMPGHFGSNGTYVGYEEKYYVLRIKILRPSQEDYEPFTYNIEIENFIRKYLLPKLQRERMSSNLRDEINKKLAKQQVVVITHDFDEDGTVSVDATYLPVGFKSWYEHLRSLF